MLSGRCSVINKTSTVIPAHEPESSFSHNALTYRFALLGEFIFFVAKENVTKRKPSLIHRRLRRYPTLLET